jgi:hypothetical protein
MADHNPTPVLQAIVICDCVYSDARTGKKVLAGTFNTLWAVEFPTVFNRSTFVYLCLTEVHREAALSMRYVDLEKNESLLSLDGLVVAAGSPLESVELSVEIPPLPMPHAGAYVFEVDCGGVILGAVRMLAQQIPPPSKDSNGHAPH